MRIIYIPKPVSVFTPVKYGLLYNGYATLDSRNITSSDDWVIPSNTQLTTLATYLGGNSVAGGKLKEAGTTYWNAPNTGATNEVGFNARGGGERGFLGSFFSLKDSLFIRSSTVDGIKYYLAVISSSSSSIDIGTTWSEDNRGAYSVRLLYTGSGSPTSYTDNSGNVYPVVLIGTQRWIAHNLIDTKYRNGDSIPEVTDNAAWAALTTGALAAYNNDWSNV